MNMIFDTSLLKKHLPVEVNKEGLRSDHLAAVKALSPWAQGEASIISGGQRSAESKLANIYPGRYAKTRNHLKGAVTELSPYIRHGQRMIMPMSCQRILRAVIRAWRQ